MVEMRVLVVEDDRKLGAALRQGLKEQGLGDINSLRRKVRETE